MRGSSSAVEHNLAKVGVASSILVSRSKTLWLSSKVVMQRPAKPCTPVRFRSQPRFCARVVKLVDTRDLKSLET